MAWLDIRPLAWPRIDVEGFGVLGLEVGAWSLGFGCLGFAGMRMEFKLFCVDFFFFWGGGGGDRAAAMAACVWSCRE